MTRFLIPSFLLWLICAPLAASAGAWMRGEKDLFLSFSSKITTRDDTGARHQEHGIFLEYGLSLIHI